jgi:hypothetical protein
VTTSMPGRGVRSLAVPFAFTVGFAVLLAMSMLVSTWPLISPDTGGYLIHPEAFLGPAESSQQDFTVPLVAWGSLSFLGNAYREWPTVLLYWIGAFPFGMRSRILLQVAVEVLAYGLFAYAAWRTFRRSVAIAGLLLVGLFLITSTGLTHALTIGPESLAFSLSLVAISAALLAFGPAGTGRRAALAWSAVALVAGFVAMNTRFTLLPVFLAAAIAGLVVGLRERGRARWLVLGSLAVALVAGLGWGVMVQHNRNLAFGTVSDQAYRVFYQLHPTLNAFAHEQFQQSLPADAPACLRDFPNERMSWTRMTQYGTEVCGAEGIAWINDNYTRLMAEYYLLHPANSLRYFSYNSVYGSGTWSDPRVWTPLPATVDSALFSDVEAKSNVVLLGLGAVVVALVMLPVVIVRARRRGRPFALPVFLVSTAVLLWSAFFLSFADHPEAAARKCWPAFPLAMVLSLWTAGILVSRRGVEQASAGESGSSSR